MEREVNISEYLKNNVSARKGILLFLSAERLREAVLDDSTDFQEQYDYIRIGKVTIEEAVQSRQYKNLFKKLIAKSVQNYQSLDLDTQCISFLIEGDDTELVRKFRKAEARAKAEREFA